MTEAETPPAVSGAVMSLRVLADNTVRLTIDCEPKDAKACMTLFGRMGQPVALAALKDGFAAAGAKVPDLARGPLCREAISLCANQKFHEFIAIEHWNTDQQAAKGYILSQCGIESRNELDTNEQAAAKFRIMRRRFWQWLDAQEPQR